MANKWRCTVVGCTWPGGTEDQARRHSERTKSHHAVLGPKRRPGVAASNRRRWARVSATTRRALLSTVAKRRTSHAVPGRVDWQAYQVHTAQVWWEVVRDGKVTLRCRNVDFAVQWAAIFGGSVIVRHRPCRLCDAPIVGGQRYHQASRAGEAHVDCAAMRADELAAGPTPALPTEWEE